MCADDIRATLPSLDSLLTLFAIFQLADAVAALLSRQLRDVPKKGDRTVQVQVLLCLST